MGINDKCWVEVEVPDPVFDIKSFIDSQVDHLLKESLPMVAEDNTSITKGDRIKWLDYRSKLKEIYLQPDYPQTVYWPSKPE